MGCVHTNKNSFELKCSNFCKVDIDSLSHADLILEKKKGVNGKEKDARHEDQFTDANTKIILIDRQ